VSLRGVSRQACICRFGVLPCSPLWNVRAQALCVSEGNPLSVFVGRRVDMLL
jgi:hypothetical protein